MNTIELCIAIWLIIGIGVFLYQLFESGCMIWEDAARGILWPLSLAVAVVRVAWNICRGES